MKFRAKAKLIGYTLASLLASYSITGYAQQPFQNDDKTAIYLDNFATYFGIDVEYAWNDPLHSSTKSLPNYTASNTDELIRLGQDLIANQLFINPLLGDVFKDPAVFTKKLYGNQKAADTPTLQAIQDLIATEPVQCSETTCLLNNPLLEHILTKLPDDLYTDNQTMIEQLDIDSLLAPLSYQKQTNGSGFGSRSSNNEFQQDTSEQGNALNFVRYLSLQFNPVLLPSYQEYHTQRFIAQDNSDPQQQAVAALNLANYILNQRGYAAQTSVSLSNLNDIFARRVVNEELEKSQAQIEYEMATQRLEDGQWQQEMEQVAPIVLQQQMLFLLAEINHQLYLNRVQNERILATLSAMHLNDVNLAREDKLQLQPLD